MAFFLWIRLAPVMTEWDVLGCGLSWLGSLREVMVRIATGMILMSIILGEIKVEVYVALIFGMVMMMVKMMR